MSREYTPDKWVLLEINKGFQKVLAGWSGGYLDGDRWKLSSGVVEVKEDGDYYMFHNYSGSVYKCHKKSNGLSILTTNILSNIKKQCKENNILVQEIGSIELGKREVLNKGE